jgi:predicted GNAT family N-acyltransferase
MKKSLIVETVDFKKCEKQIFHVRNQVFVKEQNVPVELEIDGFDDNAIHVLAWDNKNVIGTGRMMPDGHMGRICVIKSHRGIGIGRFIVKTLIDTAEKMNFLKVWLASQCRVTGFYKELGFVETGKVFDDAGIDHIKMVKMI